MRLTTKTTVLAAAVLALSATTALAGGFALREQSAEAQGNSFAGVAAGTDGLSAMFWNPATLTQHASQGLVTEAVGNLIIPYSKGTGNYGPLSSSGNLGSPTPVPASYMSYAISDDLVLGMGINAPFGLTTDANTWAGLPHGDKSKVATYDFSPTVAYKISDMISVGAGLQINYMTVDLNNRNPANGLEFARFKGDDWGLGYTFGLLLEPSDATSIGIGFRSSIKQKLEGTGKNLLAGFPFGQIAAPFKSPETVTVGISHKATEQLTVKAGVEWTNWSRFKDLTITRTDTGAVVGSTPENWHDGWFYSLGADYDYSDDMTLRAGVAYEKSPVSDAFRTVRMPDNDRYWASLGGSYKLTDRATASLAYSHVFMKDGGVVQGVTANFKQHLDILSASLTMDW